MQGRRRLIDPSAFFASALIHGVILGGLGAWFVARSLENPAQGEAEPRTVEVTVVEDETRTRLRLPRASGTSGESELSALPPEPEALVPGGVKVSRPDMVRAGRGGTDLAEVRALNLADSIDGITRNRDAINRFDRSQVQRIDTAALRRSLDDRRATPNPMELSFVASGDGLLHERRHPSRFDPERGRNRGGRPSRLGGLLGGPHGSPVDGWGARPGANATGSEQEDAAGVRRGRRGGGFRRNASVVTARPAVPRARAAVPAPARGRPNDTVDSSHEVASAVQSLIHASAAGGKLGPGPGGQPGPGRPASGGENGWGSRSAPAGSGGSGDVASDPRFSGYFRSLEQHIDWEEAFPTWAIAEGRGGMAIIAFTLQRDGHATHVRVVRGSGIPEYDRNLVAAVRRALFPPLPPALAHQPQRVQYSFDATNPAVGRNHP